MQLIQSTGDASRLGFSDFFFFSYQFKEILEEELGFCDVVCFLKAKEDVEAYALPASVHDYVNRFFDKQGLGFQSTCIGHHILIFFSTKNGVVAAVAQADDTFFTGNVSDDWLQKVASTCEGRFVLIKGAGTDYETGLLNLSMFSYHLERLCVEGQPSLMFVEAFPKVNSASDSKRHKATTTRLLQEYLGGATPIYFLGDHTYGLLFAVKANEELQFLAEKLIVGLRREGVKRVHIGIHFNDVVNGDKSDIGKIILSLYEETWSALRGAERKGPFAFCDYGHLVNPGNHLLQKPGRSVFSTLQKIWKEWDQFCLVQIQVIDDAVRQRVFEDLGNLDSVVADENIYLLVEERIGEEVEKWIRERLRVIDHGNLFVGIAQYPHVHFSKNQIVLNCLKAVQHAKFYGPGGIAVFDGVSCNVSGDIYFAEGDLRAAIKEYKTGLLCTPGDSNLLNSLGVAYADIGNIKFARECFLEVLKEDEDNFMAVYNLGLGYEVSEERQRAIRYYETAVRLESEEFVEAKRDLQLRLGRLYCDVERYEDAIGVLLPWYKDEANVDRKGKALSYLGRSYFGMERFDVAADYLQKSLRFDGYDAVSMGLLGYLYLLQREGDEIAVSLSRRSVDIEPDNVHLKLYLGRVLLECGRCAEARSVVKRCLYRKATKLEAQIIVCRSFVQEKNFRRARFWLKKIDNIVEVAGKLSDEVHTLTEQCREKKNDG